MASIKDTVNRIITLFEQGDIPQAIAYSMFPIPNVPSASWSMMNRLLMFFSGTQDARGFRQWKQVKRYVKKGSKAFHILVPCITTVVDEDTEEERRILKGFLCAPVFRFEDTDGEPLDYEQIKLPDFPLVEKAQEWGISVKAIPGRYTYWGYFSQTRNEIALATPEETVFFHELAHAAHARLLGTLKPGQHWNQEIVAELSAAALSRLVGKTTNSLGNSYRYISDHAEKASLSPVQGCLQVLSDVEKVLHLILDSEQENEVDHQKPVNFPSVQDPRQTHWPAP